MVHNSRINQPAILNLINIHLSSPTLLTSTVLRDSQVDQTVPELIFWEKIKGHGSY